MKKGPNPKAFMAGAAGALAIGIAITYFAWNNLCEAQSQLEEVRGKSRKPAELQAELASTRTQLATSTTQIQHLELGVPTYAYVPTMLAELEKTGLQCGIDVTGVRPIPKPASAPKPVADGEAAIVTKKAYDELDIEVRGRGEYRSVMNFVSALGKFPKIVAARTVEMTPVNDPLNKGGHSLDVVVNLRAYVFATKPTDGGGSNVH